MILSFNLLCSPAAAQRITRAVQPAQPADAIRTESLEAEIKSLQENQGLDETVRKKAIDLPEKASKELSRAAALDTELQTLENEVQAAPREIIKIQPQLNTPLRFRSLRVGFFQAI